MVKEKITLKIVLIIGILLILGGLGLGIYNLTNYKNYVEKDAIIKSIKVTYDSYGEPFYDVKVDFEYNGVKYTDVDLNYWDNDMFTGKEIKIMCNKNNPTDITVKSSWYIVPILLTVFGIFLTTTASVTLYKKSKNFN